MSYRNLEERRQLPAERRAFTTAFFTTVASWTVLGFGMLRTAEAGAVSGQLTRAVFLLLVLRVTRATGYSEAEDESEDLSLPVPLDADLLLALAVVCVGICVIAGWEFLKWCLKGIISRREAGTEFVTSWLAESA